MNEWSRGAGGSRTTAMMRTSGMLNRTLHSGGRCDATTTQMSDQPVLLSLRDGAVLTLTLNRPERRNACNPEPFRALRDAMRDLEDDRGVRAVVITGAGGAFCSGADLAALTAEEHPMRRMRVVNEVIERLRALPMPTVATVDGVAVGAGWNLALACDLVVAAPAARFSQIVAKRGLSLDAGGLWLLPRLVGMQQAKRLALLAEMIDADEARAQTVNLASSSSAASAASSSSAASAASAAFRDKVDPDVTGEWQVAAREMQGGARCEDGAVMRDRPAQGHRARPRARRAGGRAV